MKRLSKIFLSLLIIITAVAGLSRPVNADDGFVIQKHVVEMNVHEDGSILVTETMDVHFYESMHGIYVNIPKEYHMNWTIDGVDYYRTYNFPVIRSKVLSDHKSKIEVYTEGVQIRIGDADKYANMDETYKFQYEIVTRDLDLNGLQMLFMNIVSGKWRAVTNSVEFTIVMPKQFDASKILFDSPEGVTSVSKGALEFTANGNIIRGSYNEPLAPGEAITVQLMLDNDYFTFPSMDAHGLNSCIISLVVLIAYAVIFYLFGKDDPLVDSVEFHAPAGVNSAEVGVIIDGEANDGDVISLILDWGRRGLLTISDEKDGLKLIKKAEMEATAKGYEKHMFDVLFKNREEVVVEKLKNKFYRTIQHTEKMLDKHFMAKTRQLFTTASKTLQIVLAVLSFLPMGIACLLVSYGYEYEWAMGIFMMCLTAVLIVPVSGIMIYMDNKRYMHRWYVKTLLYIVCAFLFAIAVIILEYLFGHAGVNVIYSIPVILANLTIIIIVRLMKKRTEYGNQLLGQVLGLRNFILVAEEDRLAQLLDENPYYFYDILPYAYALGLTDVWNEHFRNLTVEPCEWYVGPHYDSTYHMMHSLESHMTVMERDLTSAPSSSSGGGSFSSSGGSSGGGFSGGGFGGSGGGGW